jgi:hypothetical protein
MGRAYMDFAFGNPSQYRVMFATELVHQKTHSEEFMTTASGALSTLMEVVAQGRGGSEAEVKKAAFFAWSAVHGAVMLHLDGTFPFESDCVCGDSAKADSMPPQMMEKHLELGLTITEAKIEQLVDLVVRALRV